MIKISDAQEQLVRRVHERQGVTIKVPTKPYYFTFKKTYENCIEKEFLRLDSINATTQKVVVTDLGLEAIGIINANK